MRDRIPATALEHLHDAVALLVAIEVSQRDTQVRKYNESETFQRRAIGRNEQVHRVRSGEQADTLESGIEGRRKRELNELVFSRGVAGRQSRIVFVPLALVVEKRDARFLANGGMTSLGDISSRSGPDPS